MRILLLFSICISFTTFAQSPWDFEKIEVKDGDSLSVIVSADPILNEGWNNLAHPNFWKRIMALSPDSCIVNVAKSRQIFATMSNSDWNAQTNEEKDQYRDSVRAHFGLNSEDRIFVTTGKNHFYKFNAVYPQLSRGIAAFEQNNVDPWYAQAILLIESPGQMKKSRVGAYGPFQLMPKVARAQGLTVNSYKDEREDFDRSAFGASQLLKKVCIPEAKRILNQHGMAYEENDLWFRLFVLHVYHAGAYNVNAVVAKIGPDKATSGQELIKKMWTNSAANFGNNSQNYTQLALASQLILNDMVKRDAEMILNCQTGLIVHEKAKGASN
jgi:hypothetical protein